MANLLRWNPNFFLAIGTLIGETICLGGVAMFYERRERHLRRDANTQDPNGGAA